MRNRLLQKLTIIAIWIVISAVLYQCSRTDSMVQNQEVTDEENENESTPKQSLTQEVREETQKKQVPQGQIRVLIKTSGFADIYHEELVISSESGLYIEQNKKIITYAPDEELVITSSELWGKTMVIRAYEGGRIKLSNVSRTEDISYRGSMECYGTEKGIVLVNELPVEEYLYGVVPSEMPSAYPDEALKAQAISARTYTYFHMLSFAYPEWAAHVDDSTAFQVYQNITEQESVNQAVDATRNQVMRYQGELIESFYYSTSSGRSTGYEVWKPQEERAWLQGKPLVIEMPETGVIDDFSYDVKTDSKVIADKEKAYRAYITQGSANDVEYQEAWYRWKYTRSFENVTTFLERIEALATAYPDEISIRSRYTKRKKLTQESEILSCRITQRAASGMAQQLSIQTQNFEIVINTQQCIREALAVNGETLTRKDGCEYTLGELLPSAYFYFDALYEGNGLKSMTIYGGGFGHGAGMSQNGAKCLANMGMTAEDILKYYYTDIEIEELAD